MTEHEKLAGQRVAHCVSLKAQFVVHLLCFVLGFSSLLELSLGLLTSVQVKQIICLLILFFGFIYFFAPLSTHVPVHVFVAGAHGCVGLGEGCRGVVVREILLDAINSLQQWGCIRFQGLYPEFY